MKLTKQNLATGLSATFIPAAIMVGTTVGSLAKLTNPDDVNVTNELAYLGFSVVPALITLIGMVLMAAALCLLLRRRDGNFSSARLPLTILLINVLLGAGILLFREIDGVAQDNWARNNGQQTREERSEQLDKYFEAIERDGV